MYSGCRVGMGMMTSSKISANFFEVSISDDGGGDDINKFIFSDLCENVHVAKVCQAFIHTLNTAMGRNGPQWTAR